MTARDHNKLLSIFFFIMGGLQLLAAIFIVLMNGGMGTFILTSAKRDEEQAMGGMFLVLGIFIGLFIMVFAGLFLFTGWKLLKEQAIGRTLGIVGSILSLLSFPLGTALGIYGLWFFFGDQGKAFYSGYRGNLNSQPPPPPPNSWQ
ncbi:MAG: hypothetical protein ACR2F2_06875 [Pyrinomonadaceae bacterium]